MEKKNWSNPEIWDLSIQNTESTWKQTDFHDGVWTQVYDENGDPHQWLKHS